MSVNDQYALNWSNHTNHLRKAFDTLLTENEFVDVTLSCEGKKIGAHKILLSACSTYFHDLFRDNPCQHPIVILKDVKFQNLYDILKFMYSGEVSVSTDNLDSFLKTAELLQVSGLSDDTEKDDKFVENQINEQPPLEFLPISKELARKRTIEESSAESTSHKKTKEDNMKHDVEIKQEYIEANSLDHEFLPILDPLEAEQQNVSTEEIEHIQPAEPQKFTDLRELLKDIPQPSQRNDSVIHLPKRCPPGIRRKTLRKRCKICTAAGKRTDTIYHCALCENFPGLCLEPCFKIYHKY